MVKLQLLQQQIQSLQVSEEDSENLYLQQISLQTKTRKEQKDVQKPTQQAHSLVPLLSSRSVSPHSQNEGQTEESKANLEEEKISATDGENNSSRPARLKPSDNQST